MADMSRSKRLTTSSREDEMFEYDHNVRLLNLISTI